MTMKNIKWSKMKKIKGTTARWATVKFTYQPPSETQEAITKVQKVVDDLDRLIVYLHGMKKGAGLGPLNWSTIESLELLLNKNRERLSELKAKDEEERLKVKSKKK